MGRRLISAGRTASSGTLHLGGGFYHRQRCLIQRNCATEIRRLVGRLGDPHFHGHHASRDELLHAQGPHQSAPEIVRHFLSGRVVDGQFRAVVGRQAEDGPVLTLQRNISLLLLYLDRI